MSVPRLFSMFRNVQTEPRKFAYKSRYFDPKKEEFEDRKRRIEREVARDKGEAVEDYTPRSGSFRSSWKRQNTYRRRSRSANRRLLLILAVMMIFIYMAIKWLEGTEFWLVK
jgi:hypothetical protein